MPDAKALGLDPKFQALGQPTLYVFSLPGCRNCAEQSIYAGLAAQKFPRLRVVFVTTASQDNVLSSVLGAKSAGSNKPRWILDPRGKMFSTLDFGQLPATALVDGKNVIRGLYEGLVSDKELLELSGSLVSRKTPRQMTVKGGVGDRAVSIAGMDWKAAKNNLLIFHSSTCEPCAREIPTLLELARAQPKLAVWIAGGRDIEATRKQFAGAPTNLKIVPIKREHAEAFRVSGTPSQVLISSSGLIRWKNEGYSSQTFARLPLE